MLCIGVGLIQFLRPKRGAGHRARGYFYVYAMLVADGTAMLLYRFSGSFNLFHVAAIVNLTCIVLAVVPLPRRPRAADGRFLPHSFIPRPQRWPQSPASEQNPPPRAPPTTRGHTGLESPSFFV